VRRRDGVESTRAGPARRDIADRPDLALAEVIVKVGGAREVSIVTSPATPRSVPH
jgi:hypothetical protein